MKKTKTALRKAFLITLKIIGLLRLWRFVNRGKVTILALHSVVDRLDNSSWEPLREGLSVERLALGVRILSKYYNFISIDEAVSILRGRKRTPNHAMALTFDDGYYNSVACALPILERYGIPMIVYLPTSYVGNGRSFWFDRLDFALQNASVADRDFEIKGKKMTFCGTDRSSLKKSFKKLRDIAKDWCTEGEELENTMGRLANQLEEESGYRLGELEKGKNCLRVLEWNEIRSALGRNVHFGSHTVDHVRLGYLNDETEIRRQLADSKEVIAKETGRPCQHLCYPNGSFSSLAVRIAKECGYSSAVSSEPGLNGNGSNLMCLCRLPFPDSDDEQEILYVASGLSQALNRVKEKVKEIFANG